MYKIPKKVQENAKKALMFKEKYPNEVKAMTRVGWTRARQLSKGGEVSLGVVKRIKRFDRHKKNAKIEPQHRKTPWRDKGYVAWLGWGGTEGVQWAKNIVNKVKKQ